MPAKKKVAPKESKEKDKAVKGTTKETTEESCLSAADKLRSEGVVCTYALSSKSMHRNVRDINVSNLTVLYHGNPLVEEAELSLNYGNRYGYIGRNGCGKSTFMRVIGARCFPIPDGIDIFHLREEIEASDMTAKEAVMSVDVERAKLEAEAETLNDIMAAGEEGSEENEDAMERLTQVYERLEEMDAATAETRASKILSGLGFTPEKQNKMTKEFSGGWRMRIALARALFIQPTLLLLDEPTNHLDMEAVVWLEDYLSKWTKILFLVSHSQDFLNNVCTHMVNHQKTKLVYYSGNYDSFVNTRSEKEEEQGKRFKNEQDQIKHMKEYVARFGQGNAKMARQAQSKEKTLEKMLRSGLTDKVEHEKALDFKFGDPGKLSPPVLQCNEITFGYPGCEILFANVDFGIDLDSRIALVGPNGAGKSTLLKVMTGELLPVHGAVRPHAHLRISKFSQHFIDVLDLAMTPLDYFMQLWADLTREDCRKFLGRFGITGIVQTTIMGNLSDGQKSRVVLAKMAKENPHLLFLDEPTNHLDMESIDSLAKAINMFEGGVVLVSHDMRLISQVAKEIWLCDNRTVSKYAGEISDFKMHLRKQMQKDNLIDNATDPRFVSIVPSSSNSLTANAQAAAAAVANLKVAPPATVKTPAAAAPAASSAEDEVRRARLELAEMAIARQRARKAGESSTSASSTSASGASGESAEPESAEAAVPVVLDEEAQLKLDEKLAQKARRKAEKEAAAELDKREEEERQRRKEEKARDIEEAKRIREIEKQRHEEFLVMKAAKEAKKKAEEDAEAAIIADKLEKRRAEKEARKQARAAQKKAEQDAILAAAEAAVLADPWTQQQQELFEGALLEFTSGSVLDKRERWARIAAVTLGKTMNQCMARYKFLKAFVVTKKKGESSMNEL